MHTHAYTLRKVLTHVNTLGHSNDLKKMLKRIKAHMYTHTHIGSRIHSYMPT